MSQGLGIVHGLPAKFIRVEAIAVFAFSIWLVAIQGLAWWLYPLLLLVPDVFMLGYLLNTRLGAIWLGHIGMDRAMGYGLKYHDSFKHTHLSNLK